MIEVYPVKIEAVMDGESLFRLETFDESSATLHFDGMVSQDMLDDLFASIRKGVEMLELKPDE